MTNRESLRTTFGEDAEHYNRCRPGYPDAVFAELAALGPIDARSSVLELGCGTGHATVPLAQLGCAIVAVELSADLAAVATRRLADFPAARVVVSAFEDWPLPADGFDVVLSATAFHWLDPEIRTAKAADALRPGGLLALISTHHVAGGTESFFTEVQKLYERLVPGTPPGVRLPATDEVPKDSAELDESGRFGPVRFHRYEWEQTYTTARYLDLLLTYSGHRSVPPEPRRELLAAIADLIDTGHSGRVTKRYLTRLATTRRRR